VEPDADAELRFRGGGADPHQTREYYSRHSREGIERRRSHMPTEKELLGLPAGHVTQLPGASKFDGRLNRERFEQRALLDMDREIALVYNKHTGQYAMVQGERSSVAMESELTAVLAGDTEWQAMGWVILAHTHPRSAAELETSAANRWPSLADWNALALQSHRYPGTQQSEVKFFAKNDRAGTSHRVETTRFIYDPDPHATGAYVVRQPTGRTETFASIEDYLEFVRIELGVSDASVPQKFFGRTRSGVSRTGSAIEEPATANP
jgi:uncharacterized protein YchJ